MKYLALLLLLLYLTGCDPMPSHRTYINNISQKDLKIYVYSNHILDPSLKPYDSLIVKSKSKELLFSFNERSNAKICTNPKDSIIALVHGDNTLKVSLDLNKESNYTSSGNKKMVECTATIRDSDIVPK